MALPLPNADDAEVEGIGVGIMPDEFDELGAVDAGIVDFGVVPVTIGLDVGRAPIVDSASEVDIIGMGGVDQLPAMFGTLDSVEVSTKHELGGDAAIHSMPLMLAVATASAPLTACTQ